MSMASNNFAARVLEEYGPIEPFKPFAIYNSDGDCVEFYFSNEPQYARRLDGLVTVFFSEQTHEIVGGSVKGVHTSLLERFPGLRVFIEGESTKVAVILSGPALLADGEPLQRTYKTLIDKADEVDMSAQLQPA